MITGSKEYLDDVAKNYLCSEHGTPVVVAWHATENSYVLRCGQGHYPDFVTRQLSLTQAYLAGEEIPEPIKSNIEKSMRRRQMQQSKQSTAVTLGGVPGADLGTGELLLPEVIKALVEYAKSYHLDPGRGHVVLMYGKPYITIDGYLYHAKGTKVEFSLVSRPLCQTEREDYKIGADDHAWIATVDIHPERSYFTGLGIVTQEEMTEESKKKPGQLRAPVVAAHPWQLAQKRAEWQALRRAFPIGETKEGKGEAGDQS